MSKGYSLVAYRSVREESAVKDYGKLAIPAIQAGSRNFGKARLSYRGARMKKKLAICFIFVSLQLVAAAYGQPGPDTPSARVVDSNASFAKLFLASSKGSDSVTLGVGRVTGTVYLDTAFPDHSVVDLSIYPSDEDWARSLDQSGNLPPKYVPDPTDHTLLTFHSKRSITGPDGNVRVIGDLTVTTVERRILSYPSEGLGPIYADPVPHATTRQVSFIFSKPNAAVALQSSSGAKGQKNVLEVTASSGITNEDFQELPAAITATNWPPVVANGRCEAPNTLADGYSGPVCTRTVLATTAAENCYVPSYVGEGYSGPICSPAPTNLTTIVLEVELDKGRSGL